MSTKIYNAYLLQGHDLGSAAQLLQKFKMGTLRPMMEQLKTETLARRAVQLFDKATLGLDSEKGNYVSRAWREMRDEQKNAIAGMREPDVDFGCKLSLINHRSGVYVVMYSEQAEYTRAWEKLPGIVDFSYWNNTDRPDEVSAKDWKKRERVWDSIFKGEVRSPDDAGLSIELLPVDGSWRTPEQEKLLEALPSMDQRVANVHIQAAAQELIKKDDIDDTLSAIWNLPNHPRYTEVGETVRSKLVPEISWQHLTGETVDTMPESEEPTP